MIKLHVRIKGACFVQILMCFNSALNLMLSDELHLTQYTYQDKSTKILPRNWKRFRPQLRDAWEITLKLYFSVNVLV